MGDKGIERGEIQMQPGVPSPRGEKENRPRLGKQVGAWGLPVDMGLETQRASSNITFSLHTH